MRVILFSAQRWGNIDGTMRVRNIGTSGSPTDSANYNKKNTGVYKYSVMHY
jgi:hypothetical protein